MRKNAEACNKPVDDEIFKYIATNIKSNIRELEGAFNRIIELFNSNKITDSESVKILFNLVEKKKTINHKHFKYPVVGFPYLEDPFLINTSLFGTLDKISERN